MMGRHATFTLRERRHGTFALTEISSGKVELNFSTIWVLPQLGNPVTCFKSHLQAPNLCCTKVTSRMTARVVVRLQYHRHQILVLMSDEDGEMKYDQWCTISWPSSFALIFRFVVIGEKFSSISLLFLLKRRTCWLHAAWKFYPIMGWDALVPAVSWLRSPAFNTFRGWQVSTKMILWESLAQTLQSYDQQAKSHMYACLGNSSSQSYHLDGWSRRASTRTYLTMLAAFKKAESDAGQNGIV